VNRVEDHSGPQSLVRDYFRDLDSALSGLPRARRTQLVSEIRQHVDAALAEQPPRSSAEMRNLLDRVGRPDDIAAAALEEEPGQPRRPMRTGQKVLIAGVSALVLAGVGTGLAFALTVQWPSRGAAAASGPAAASRISSRPSISAASSGPDTGDVIASRVLARGTYGFTNPTDIAADGTHIWVANYNGNSVTELNASDGNWVRTLSGGTYGFSGPYGIATDGTHIWVTNNSGGSVTELNASDGSWVRTPSGGTYGFNYPTGIAVDGNRIWVTNYFEVMDVPLSA